MEEDNNGDEDPFELLEVDDGEILEVITLDKDNVTGTLLVGSEGPVEVATLKDGDGVDACVVRIVVVTETPVEGVALLMGGGL